MRCPPSLAAGRRFCGPEELFRRIVNQYGIVSDRAPVVVEIVRALAVGVVSPTVNGQIATVIDRDLVLIEVLMFGEVWAAVEFDPG